MTDDVISQQTIFPDGPAAVASLLEPALAEVAGLDAEPVSLTIDYGLAAQPGAAVDVEAGVDRATRTLVFAYGRVLNGEGAVLATGSAVFRKVKAR
jgi:acyl-coenzyme A thioesterase PaaI-like protein